MLMVALLLLQLILQLIHYQLFQFLLLLQCVLMLAQLLFHEGTQRFRLFTKDDDSLAGKHGNLPLGMNLHAKGHVKVCSLEIELRFYHSVSCPSVT